MLLNYPDTSEVNIYPLSSLCLMYANTPSLNLIRLLSNRLKVGQNPEHKQEYLILICVPEAARRL